MAVITDIADALVTALQTAGFSEAERKSLPYFDREDCADRKCVVVARNNTYGEGHRADFDTVCEMAIVLQKAVPEATQDAAVDTLLDDVETLVSLWGEGGALRHSTLSGSVYEDGPEHPTGSLYEPAQLAESNLFHSVTIVRYRLEG